MHAAELGASGVSITPVGLGGYWLGAADPDAAAAVLAASRDAGVGWVDTAEAYFDGGNESNLGAALRAVPEMAVASKIWPRRTTADAAGVRRACEASLRRLRREVLDVYFVHAPDPHVPLEETWTAMARLVADGLVRAIGLSNHTTDDVRRAHALRPVDVVQDGLSLIDNVQNRGHLAECAEVGIAGVVYEPLANGLLTGHIHAGSDLTEQREWPGIFERLFAPGKFEHSLDVVERVRGLAEAWGWQVPQVALAWCLHQTGVSSVLAGTTSAEHARSNAAAGRIRLSPEQLDLLEEVIPRGPAFVEERRED